MPTAHDEENLPIQTLGDGDEYISWHEDLYRCLKHRDLDYMLGSDIRPYNVTAANYDKDSRLAREILWKSLSPDLQARIQQREGRTGLPHTHSLVELMTSIQNLLRNMPVVQDAIVDFTSIRHEDYDSLGAYVVVLERRWRRLEGWDPKIPDMLWCAIAGKVLRESNPSAHQLWRCLEVSDPSACRMQLLRFFIQEIEREEAEAVRARENDALRQAQEAMEAKQEAVRVKQEAGDGRRIKRQRS